MARRFNGSSDYIVFTLPTTLETVVAGSTTIVCVANFADGTDGAMVHARTSGGTNSWWMETAGNVWNYGQGVTAKNVGGQTNGSWAAYIGRKTTGGANAPRGRKIIFGGATTDTTAGTGLADGTAPGSGGILQVGRWGTAAEYINADIAAVAVFNSDLSDATTAGFTTWSAILAASPVWAVHFDQASATDAITDATGNGGNSSSITGTTIVANPSGFFSSSTNLDVGNAASSISASSITATSSLSSSNAASSVTANAVTLNARPSAGSDAVTVAGNPAVLLAKPAAGNGAVTVGAFDVAVTSGTTLQVGNAASSVSASSVVLRSSPSSGNAASGVSASSITATSSLSSGSAAATVGAFGITVTGGATGLAAGGAIIGVGAFGITLSGGTVGQVSGSWYGLLDVLQEIRANADYYRSAPPVACPRCGEPLQTAIGVLWCRFDGWKSEPVSV